MKRFGSQESLGSIVYSPPEKKNQKQNLAYGAEFQAMLDGLDDDDFTEEGGQSGEKKRRLRFDQVKALEKIFEVDNKLEPEQKVKIARELGLQPRQVGIWFQNRRARWKTKHLESDYGILKANYEELKLKFDKLEREKEGLVAEVKELRAKLGEENTESNHCDKEERLFLDAENNVSEQRKVSPLSTISHQLEQTNPDYEIPENANSIAMKDGLWKRNCSGHFNEESDLNSPLLMPLNSSALRYDCSSSSSSVYSPWMNCFQLLDSGSKGYPHQFVKMEEQSTLFSTEDCSNILSLDQAPTLNWHQ